jgi:hypothetical protein
MPSPNFQTIMLAFMQVLVDCPTCKNGKFLWDPSYQAIS